MLYCLHAFLRLAYVALSEGHLLLDIPIVIHRLHVQSKLIYLHVVGQLLLPELNHQSGVIKELLHILGPHIPSPMDFHIELGILCDGF